MKRIFFITIIFFSFLLNAAFSQHDEEENETGESIIQRSQFISERRAGGPGKKLPKDAYQKALLEKQKIPLDRNNPGSPTSGTSWESVNPTGMFYARTGENFISGRTNSIAFHPTNPNIMYIAAAQGGVWKTTDAGITWTVLTDNLGSIASGDIAIDPNNPDILYYGTGELNYSLDSQYGDGIYKSTNAGLNWTRIAAPSSVGYYISKIIVDPSNSNTVYFSGSNGVFKSTNAGLNWTGTLGLNAGCLLMNNSDPLTLYTSSGSGGSSIYKTSNGGINWTLSISGITGSGRRTAIAISKGNPNYLYASIENNSGGLLGLYRTTNGAANWTLQASTPNYLGSQGWYDNAVTVINGNPDGVIVGGIDCYASTNGGVTLNQISAWATFTSANFSHADIHYLTYHGTTLYCCSDGGVYKSTNNGSNWTDLNENLSTLQYQSADYDPTDIQKLYGGTQDNNKQTSTNSGVVWIQRTTGDGGYTIVDPVNTNYVYGQYVNGSIQRSADYGVSFTSITPTGSSGGLFYNPYEMAPGDHNTVVFGRANLWKTTNIQTATSSSGWTQIAATGVGGGSISAIAISKNDINKIMIGTNGGRILSTTNNGANWNLITGFPYVTDLWIDFDNDSIAYATFGGSTAGRHVYKTTDGGSNWISITNNLPNIAANSITVRQTNPKMIFVGTDLGVYMSTNEGANWVSFNTGFPNVEVYDLKYKEGPQILLAATHGRGCFTFDISNIVGINEHNIIPDKFILSQNYPNPFNPKTNINYQLNSPGHVLLKVYDALGNEVSTLVNKRQTPGIYNVSFNGDNLSSGIYFYRLMLNSNEQNSEEKIATHSMILIK